MLLCKQTRLVTSRPHLQRHLSLFPVLFVPHYCIKSGATRDEAKWYWLWIDWRTCLVIICLPGDEFFPEAAFILCTDGQRCYKRTVRHYCLQNTREWWESAEKYLMPTAHYMTWHDTTRQVLKRKLCNVRGSKTRHNATQQDKNWVLSQISSIVRSLMTIFVLSCRIMTWTPTQYMIFLSRVALSCGIV